MALHKVVSWKSTLGHVVTMNKISLEASGKSVSEESGLNQQLKKKSLLTFNNTNT